MKSVSVPVAGVDYSRKATGGEEFILSHTLITQPILVGMSWRRDHDVIGCDASTHSAGREGYVQTISRFVCLARPKPRDGPAP